jgi:hypothetical protein
MKSILVLVFPILAVAGCSGSDATPLGPKPNASSDPTSPDPGNPPAPPPVHHDASTDAPTSSSCGGESTAAACQTCCYGEHSTGSVALVEYTAACECGAGPCELACETTLCATPVVAADATCTTCVAGNIGGRCASVITQCQGVPDCSALLTCLGTCTGKP